MHCALCNGKIETMKGDIQLSNRMLGDVSIPGIEYDICMSCGDTTLSFHEGQRASEKLKEKELQAIGSLPFNAFVTHKEAAKILKITKQAFNKNSRIKRGFIYFSVKDGRKYYLKKSVLKFKENGRDGRIKLAQKKPVTVNVRPVYVTPLANHWEYGEPKYGEVINTETDTVTYLCNSQGETHAGLKTQRN